MRIGEMPCGSMMSGPGHWVCTGCTGTFGLRCRSDGDGEAGHGGGVRPTSLFHLQLPPDHTRGWR